MTSRERERLVCRCEEVSLGEIENAIDAGAATLNEVKRRTRAGMGLCQSRTCSRLIARIVAERTGRGIEEVDTVTVRPPVRPIALKVFENRSDEHEG